MKIKKEYFGQVIQTSHPKLGSITCDVDQITEEEYEYYYNNGFAYIFRKERLTPIKYKGIEDGRG